MSTLRAAADLLTSCRTAPDLDALAAHLGFGASAPLDVRTARTIGIDVPLKRAAICAGPGALRAVRCECVAGASLRESVARIAARLATETPQLLWLVLAVGDSSDEVVIAAPAPGGDRHVAALVADRRRVTASDGETLAAMADAARGADILVHQRWREVLGREALTRRFYRELERTIGELAATALGRAREGVRRELALLCTSRLLFLAFLEAKGWLDDDREFLRHRFDVCCLEGGGVHRRLLDPLFFGTLNTPLRQRAPRARALGRVPFLNGGLFARTPTERLNRDLRFSDEALGEVIAGVLGTFRVTAREQSTRWSEAAIDPEMLGRAFESLMAAPERQASGAFYTPTALIERVVASGLEAALVAERIAPELAAVALAGRAVPRREQYRLCRVLSGLRVLDPSCGSGAFLVHALERIADLARAAGDTRSAGDRRRDVLTRSIFGVDINPTAVWLCELRLWLSVVLDAPDGDPLAVAPLPNLDRHIRVGDALAGDAFTRDDAPTISGCERGVRRVTRRLATDRSANVAADTVADAAVEASAVARLRTRYSRATGVRKRTLARALDRAERLVARAEAERLCERLSYRRRDLICGVRSRDLFASRTAPTGHQRRALVELRAEAREARRRELSLRRGGPLPFAFATHFADVAAERGFSLVMTNPPWVRVHHIPLADRAQLRARYRSYREAAWMDGATLTGATRGFAAQVDLASLFVERALTITRPGGVVALLTPAKLWRSLAGGGVRRVLAEDAALLRLEDWSESASAFDAVVYPSLVVAQRRSTSASEQPVDGASNQPPTHAPNRETVVHAAVRRRHDALAWQLPSGALALDPSPGAPWLLLPVEVRAAFDRLAVAGIPLAESSIGRPLLGVKTGCNEAFIVPAASTARSAHGALPTRALIRGEDVQTWRTHRTGDRIIWTHDAKGAPLRSLPEAVRAQLAPWRRRLETRADARPGSPWWSLFRLESARHDVARVVWSDIGKSPRAAVLDAGDSAVPLNSCYIARMASPDDAHAFAALLNSPVAAAWLAALAEPARGGYHRYLGWTLARLPIPRDWPRARALLAPIGRSARDGAEPEPNALAEMALRAFGVRHRDVAPLLVWCLRP